MGTCSRGSPGLKAIETGELGFWPEPIGWAPFCLSILSGLRDLRSSQTFSLPARLFESGMAGPANDFDNLLEQSDGGHGQASAYHSETSGLVKRMSGSSRGLATICNTAFADISQLSCFC